MPRLKLNSKFNRLEWCGPLSCASVPSKSLHEILEALEFYRNIPLISLDNLFMLLESSGFFPWFIYCCVCWLIRSIYQENLDSVNSGLVTFPYPRALPFFIRKLTDFSLTRGEQFKILVNWIVELFSSFIILVVYRIEDASESPLIQMKAFTHISNQLSSKKIN